VWTKIQALTPVPHAPTDTTSTDTTAEDDVIVTNTMQQKNTVAMATTTSRTTSPSTLPEAAAIKEAAELAAAAAALATKPTGHCQTSALRTNAGAPWEVGASASTTATLPAGSTPVSTALTVTPATATFAATEDPVNLDNRQHLAQTLMMEEMCRVLQSGNFNTDTANMFSSIAAMTTTSMATKTTTSTASASSTKTQRRFNELKHHLVAWAGHDGTVLTRNNELFNRLLDVKEHTDTKKDLVKQVLDDLVVDNIDFDRIVNEELIDTIQSLHFTPDELQLRKHKKGLGIMAFLEQDHDTILQLQQNCYNEDMADDSTRTANVIRGRRLRNGKLPETALETNRFLQLMQDLYTTLFGNNCTIIPTIKKLKAIAATRARKFEKFQQTTTWPASTGNLILYAVDQGVRNMFNQKIPWASGQAGIRVQNQAFEQFATLLESGIQMESSLLPPLLQPRDAPKTSTQKIPDTTGKRRGKPQLSQDKQRLKLDDLQPATIKLDKDHAAAL
jgi:hypothetical protein